jgi:hypothetical protein
MLGAAGRSVASREFEGEDAGGRTVSKCGTRGAARGDALPAEERTDGGIDWGERRGGALVREFDGRLAGGGWDGSGCGGRGCEEFRCPKIVSTCSNSEGRSGREAGLEERRGAGRSSAFRLAREPKGK